MSKLFVITRKDLPLPDQAVQAGHVVAQYMLDTDHLQDGWRNETLAYLVVDNEEGLSRLRYKLDAKFIHYSEFFEPDRGNQLTAIACHGYDNNFSDLQMMGAA